MEDVKRKYLELATLEKVLLVIDFMSEKVGSLSRQVLEKTPLSLQLG